MHILGIDTSLAEASVALAEEDGTVHSMRRGPSSTHSRGLLGIIRELLDSRSAALEDVNAVGVSIGPGSFTGIRIGVGTAMGLADSLGKPVIGVGSLDALARAQGGSGKRYICPVISAQRGLVYAAIFSSAGPAPGRVKEDMEILPENFSRMIDGAALFVGNGGAAHAGLFQASIPHEIEIVETPARPLAEGVAEVAMEIFIQGASGEHPPAPKYISPSQAEVKWEQLHCKNLS